MMRDGREMFCIGDVLRLGRPVLTLRTPADPEVHIGLENLQQFPVFGSPPQNSSPMGQLDFMLSPPSPLRCTPESGESYTPNVQHMQAISWLYVMRQYTGYM